MYKVYWTETIPLHHPEMIKSWCDVTGETLDCNAILDVDKSQVFDSKALTTAVNFCEELRTLRRDGKAISFITMVSEDPNSVGEAGVSDKLPVGYDWKKRRQ